ncbi:MAG: hypothetical protein HRU00_14305 [Myxococcales bacterium]|nr:hypothetical protein [Myxococcales bacterium]
MDRLRLSWHADLRALDECLDRLGAPQATKLHKSLDRQAEDDEPRPSLAFRLGWLEGHVRALHDHPLYVVKGGIDGPGKKGGIDEPRKDYTWYREVVTSVLEVLVECDDWPTVQEAERCRDGSSGPFAEGYAALAEWLKVREPPPKINNDEVKT